MVATPSWRSLRTRPKSRHLVVRQGARRLIEDQDRASIESARDLDHLLLVGAKSADGQ